MLSLLPSSPEYPTASELHRARECVAPWALGLPEVRETNEWAEFGKRCHIGAEMLAHGQGIVEALSRALPEPDSSQTATIARIVEVMDPAIERDLLECKQGADGVWYVEQGIKWRPGVLEDEVVLCERQPGERLRGWFSGTADLVYVRHDNLLVVADWKFGPREAITGEPAKESCQGFFLATAFAALLGIRGSSAGVVVARFERRMVSEDGIDVDAVDITQGEIDDFRIMLGHDEFEIFNWRPRLRSEGPWNRVPLIPGWIAPPDDPDAKPPWLVGVAGRIHNMVGAMPKISAACGKCKAKAACPAWDQFTGLVVDDIVSQTGERATRALFRAPESSDDVRALHHAISAAESYSAEWKRLRDAYVLTHPEGVEIGLGLRLKAIPSKDREALDTPEALDVIERIAGPKAIEVQRKSGIGRIRAALRDGAGEGITSKSDRDKTKKAAEESGFAELVKAGAVLDKGKKLTVKVVRSDEEE